jgi:hypothetical protein
MGKSKTCCQRFLSKKKACKDCPLVLNLPKKKMKKRLKKLREAAKAA